MSGTVPPAPVLHLHYLRIPLTEGGLAHAGMSALAFLGTGVAHSATPVLSGSG